MPSVAASRLDIVAFVTHSKNDDIEIINETDQRFKIFLLLASATSVSPDDYKLVTPDEDVYCLFRKDTETDVEASGSGN